MREEEGGLRAKRNTFEACRHIRIWRRRDSWMTERWNHRESRKERSLRVIVWADKCQESTLASEIPAAQLVYLSSLLYSAHTRWLGSRFFTFLMPYSKEPIKNSVVLLFRNITFHYFICREGFFPTPLSLFQYVFLLLFNETDILYIQA